MGTNPKYMAKACAEIAQVGAIYAKDPKAPLTQQLLAVPLQARKFKFPVLQLCVNVMLRLHFQSLMLRRNISGVDIPIGDDEVVPEDAIVVS